MRDGCFREGAAELLVDAEASAAGGRFVYDSEVV